jgi:hypothetical protein
MLPPILPSPTSPIFMASVSRFDGYREVPAF